jgi:S1-C subfamily serine protease
MTYEVVRYFQRPDGDPGVVISKIEIGSKASTAGLKPFEIITHVNDQPVKSVKEFEQSVKGQQTLRLSVKRMTKGRQVKDDVPAGGEAAGGPKKPATATPGDAAEEK